MESQPQNPKFRNIPENFHPCISPILLNFFADHCHCHRKDNMGLKAKKICLWGF